MTQRIGCWGLLIGLMALPALARADGLQALEAYFKSATSGRAEFTQVVTSPTRADQKARSVSFAAPSPTTRKTDNL